MIKHKEDSIKKIREREAQEEFNQRDYRLLKQIEKIPEIKALLEAEYPGEVEWRESMRERISGLREAEAEEGAVGGEDDGLG